MADPGTPSDPDVSETDQTSTPAASVVDTRSTAAERTRAEGRPRWASLALKIATFAVALFLFILAIQLMKEGAKSLIPTLEGSIFTDNAWSTLGVGWLGACLVLSGSPVAASSLTLLDGGAIDRSQSFTMLTGSRLGASFVVLVVGVVYAARRQAGRKAPLSIGVYSLTITTFAASTPVQRATLSTVCATLCVEPCR